MPVPTLSAEQRATAAERSLELRRQRADIKRWIGEASDDENARARLVLALDFPAAKGMKLLDMLVHLPRVGQAKAKRIMADAGIPERNTVGMCGVRQRERLTNTLFT